MECFATEEIRSIIIIYLLFFFFDQLANMFTNNMKLQYAECSEMSNPLHMNHFTLYCHSI